MNRFEEYAADNFLVPGTAEHEIARAAWDTALCAASEALLAASSAGITFSGLHSWAAAPAPQTKTAVPA